MAPAQDSRQYNKLHINVNITDAKICNACQNIKETTPARDPKPWKNIKQNQKYEVEYAITRKKEYRHENQHKKLYI